MTADARKRGKEAPPKRTIPSVGQGDMSSIPEIDLDLHGDAIDHWQDEPQPRASSTGGERRKADRKD